MAQVEMLRVQLKYLGHGFLALVFMLGTLAGNGGRGFSRYWCSGWLSAETDGRMRKAGSRLGMEDLVRCQVRKAMAPTMNLG